MSISRATGKMRLMLPARVCDEADTAEDDDDDVLANGDDDDANKDDDVLGCRKLTL